MKKGKAFILIAVLAAAAVLAAGSFDLSEKRDYRDFIESVEAGDVEKARISEESIRYTLKGEKGWYSTVNPSSPSLTESLLLSGVDVGFESDSLGSALDDAFNILFLAIVAFGLYKLASWYFSTFRIVRHTGVSFSDIAGMDNLKEEMSYAVSVLRNRGEGNVRSIRGIILEGPPGNGKTLFAKALAQECGVNFIATRGADFQGALMGLGAMKVKMLFSKARRHRPCIIFIDEFDSIGERRSYAGSGIDKENNRILTTLLNEMDGFSTQSDVMVIAATNSFQSLDPALVRPGRFDLKYSVANPDRATRERLAEIYTRSKKLMPDVDIAGLAGLFEGLSCAAIESILNEAQAISERRGGDGISLDDVIEAGKRCGEKLSRPRK